MYRTCVVKNVSDSTGIFHGMTLSPNQEYTVQDSERIGWSTDDFIMSCITDSTIQVGDGVSWYISSSDQIDVLKDLHTNPVYTFDNKQFVQATSRPLGTIAYFTSVGDSTSSSTAVGGGVRLCHTHHIGDESDCTVIIDFNVKENKTYIREGYLTYSNMQFDSIDVDVIPKVTDVTSGTDTYFNLYGGYLVVPAAGTGTIQLAGTPNLVECPVSVDTGLRDPGYWNAPYSTTTHTFGDLTACPYGDGTYNMFTVPVSLSRFVNNVCFWGSGQLTLETSDSKELPHGGRLKITCHSDGTADHEWAAGVILSMFRQKLS